jgi:hypothetical protein
MSKYEYEEKLGEVSGLSSASSWRWGMLVILSDIHLTDGTSGTTIDPRAFQKFGNILSNIIGDPEQAKIKEIEIVLMGDIFDVIRSNR